MANNNIINLSLLIETTQLLMTNGIEIIRRAGSELIKSIRDKDPDSVEQFQMEFTESEKEIIIKIISNILSVLSSDDKDILNICSNNIKSLETIVTAVVNLKKTEMPPTLRNKIEQFRAESINDNNKEQWEKLEKLIYKVFY